MFELQFVHCLCLPSFVSDFDIRISDFLSLAIFACFAGDLRYFGCGVAALGLDVIFEEHDVRP
jgi:hypothetical protein